MKQTFMFNTIERLYYSGSGKVAGVVEGQRHCLMMDEVDGMAGNEDRGGMQVISKYN